MQAVRDPGRPVGDVGGIGGVAGWVAGVAAMVLIGLSAGCVGVEDLAAARAHADELRTRIVAEADAISAGGVPEGSPARVAALRDQAAALDDAIGTLDRLISEAKQPSGPVSRGVAELSALLPEPARSPVVLGGALLAMLFRARQLKTALASVARSMDKAMQADPVFRDRFQANAPTMRTLQTSTAHRVVDEATREGFMVRLPI